MVRPSQERQTKALTDAQSVSIGDGTDVGEDGVDYEGGGTNPGGGVITPPAGEPVEFVEASGDLVLDFETARFYDVTMTGDITSVTIIGAPVAGLLGQMTVTYRQGPGAPWDLTHPTADWRDTDGTGGGSPPALSTVEGAQDTFIYDTRDGGVTYGGSYDGTSSASEVFVEHGALGTTEPFDPADGNAHTGTLDDDCTATIAAPAGDGPITMEWWITGDGAHDLTIAATGGTVIGDTPPTSVDTETYRLVLDRIPGSTNDWIVNLVGGPSGGELAVDDGSTTVDPVSALTFVATGSATVAVTDGGGGAATVTIGASGSGAFGPLVIADDHSTPLIFDDLVQTEAGDDLVYADI